MAGHDFASNSLQSKQLFVEHIAARLDAMESGHTIFKAIAYRAHARMLREALKAFPRGRLDALLGAPHSALSQAVYNRCFERDGYLREAPTTSCARAIRLKCDRLLARLRQSRDPRTA